MITHQLRANLARSCGTNALTSIKGQNDVTYFRCKQRLENKSCKGAGTLTKHFLEDFIYNEMVKKMQEFQTLTGSKPNNYNLKLTFEFIRLLNTHIE